MQTVSAAAAYGVIKRKLQVVVAQEPVECRTGFATPASIASDAIRLQTRGNRACGFNRLLIESGFFTTLAIKALRSDRHEMAIDLAPLLCQQPIQ